MYTLVSLILQDIWYHSMPNLEENCASGKEVTPPLRKEWVVVSDFEEILTPV